ncbi:MAG: hypothetical protein AAF958_16280 [Planctomycetota bacterium]
MGQASVPARLISPANNTQTIQKIDEYEDGWCTSAILNRTQAHQFIGRLAYEGIDHLAVGAGEFTRILVRPSDLGHVTELQPEAPKPTAIVERQREQYATYLRMLVGIPCAAFVGNLFCYITTIQSRFIPAVCCVVAVGLAELIATARRQRRDTRPVA